MTSRVQSPPKYPITPKYLYVRDITASDTPNSDTDIFCSEILRQDPRLCGVDTETTVPTAQSRFRQQLISKPSIIQICFKGKIGDTTTIKIKYPIQADSDYTCYIFPLKTLFLQEKRLPTNLVQVLKLDTLIKTGASIRTDVREIEREFGITVTGWVDLQDLARSFGERSVSLDDLAYSYLNMNKEKSGGGDYDNKLTPNQVKYSAIDAFLSISVYEAMFKSNGVPINRTNMKRPLPSKLTDYEFIAILNYMKNKTHIFDKKEPIPFNTFYSILKTGYSNWKNEYTGTEIEMMTQRFLDRMVGSSQLVFDEIMETYTIPERVVQAQDGVSPLSVMSEEQLSILKGRVRDVIRKQVTNHGIVRNSLINILVSTFSRDFQKEVSPSEIKKFLASIIDDITAKSKESATPGQFLIREIGGDRKYYKIDQKEIETV